MTLTLSDAGSSNSMGDPLTLRTPFPFLTVALATAFFFRPKHWTNWFLVSDMVEGYYGKKYIRKLIKLIFYLFFFFIQTHAFNKDIQS